jgi:hypothetical protein
MICDSITDNKEVLQRSIDPLASFAAEIEDTAADCFPQIDKASPDKLLMGDFKLGKIRGETLRFMASPFIGWRALQICVICPFG